MVNPTLVIYDNDGKVWGVYGGVTVVPAGVQGLIADAPRSFKSVHVNLDTHKAVFDPLPDTESEVSNLQDLGIDHEERIAALEALIAGGNA